MARNTSQVRGWVMLIGSNILFAGAYVSGKFALAEVSPITLNALRFLIAGAFVAPIVIRNWRKLPTKRADILKFVGITVCSFVLNKLFEYIGLNLTTATDGALLISSEGLFTAALSWLVLRERATWAGGSALLLGFFGAYLVVERGIIPNLGSEGALDRRILGDGIFALSLLFEAIANVISKRLTGSFSPLIVTSATVLGSLLVWLPAGAVDISGHGLHLTLPATLGIVYLALMVTIAGYFLWFGGLQRVDGSAAAVTLFIQPLVGTLLAVVILRESLSYFTLLGGGCIIASVWLITWFTQRSAALDYHATTAETL